MNCPVCSLPLIVIERQGIELDCCSVCKGIWFDAGELGLLSQALNLRVNLPEVMSILATATKERPRACPRCDKRMDKILLAGVMIDRCRRGHGLWFDWGEVGQVLERSAVSQPSSGGQIIKFLSETIRVGRRP